MEDQEEIRIKKRSTSLPGELLLVQAPVAVQVESLEDLLGHVVDVVGPRLALHVEEGGHNAEHLVHVDVAGHVRVKDPEGPAELELSRADRAAKWPNGSHILEPRR